MFEPATIRVSCPAQSSLLALLRSFVNDVCRDVRIPEQERTKVVMAVDEACSNIVAHAYKATPKAGASADDNPRLDLTFRIEKDSLEIQVKDHGLGLKIPWHKTVHVIEEYNHLDTHHGLGFYIMHLFMDEVSIDFPEEHGTVVTMKKYLSA